MVSSFTRRAVAGNRRQPISTKLDQKRSRSPKISEKYNPFGDRNHSFGTVGSEMCWRGFPATARLEKREVVLDVTYVGEFSTHYENRNALLIAAAVARANVLKFLFPS